MVHFSTYEMKVNQVYNVRCFRCFRCGYYSDGGGTCRVEIESILRFRNPCEIVGMKRK